MDETSSKETCPLCDSEATFTYTSQKDRKRYECLSCIHPFLIARKAENCLRASFAASTRQTIAERVRATLEGTIADIYCPSQSPDDPAECKVNLDFVSLGDAVGA